MTTDHEMRMYALQLFEILQAVDHTLTVHGHVDGGTPLHDRITAVLAERNPAFPDVYFVQVGAPAPKEASFVMLKADAYERWRGDAATQWAARAEEYLSPFKGE